MKVFPSEDKDEQISLKWNRNHVYDFDIGQIFVDHCTDYEPEIRNIASKKLDKYRPRPLKTTTALKLFCKHLGMTGYKAMHIMEILYNRRYISWPKTDTNVYSDYVNLKDLVKI